MPPRKPAKQPRKLWDEEIMKKALKAVVENKMGYLTASRVYNVPRTSLHRFVTQIKRGEEITLQHSKLGRRPVLTEKLEEALAECALELQRNNFTLTGVDLREMAYQIALKHGIRTPFMKDKIAGRHWLRDFLRRNPRVLCDEAMHKDERELLKLTENLTCEMLIDEFGVAPVADDDDDDFDDRGGNDDEDYYDDD